MSKVRTGFKFILKGLDLTLLVFIFAPILLLAIGVMIPISMSDNVNKYQGNERIVAQSVLDYTNEFRSHGKEMIGGIGVFKRQVHEVIRRDVPEAGVFSRCKEFYEVRIADVHLFGLKSVDDQGRYECIE